MSANMEHTMAVDEEYMQIDEDPTSAELPMSTDEDSAQDTGVATKDVDVAMVSDGPDVDGNVVDTETIISDDTTRYWTDARLRKELTRARATRTRTSEPSTPTSTKSNSSRLLKLSYIVTKGNSSVHNKCRQCARYQRCHWEIETRTGNYYICSDKCLGAHRVQTEKQIIQTADLNNLKKKCALCSAIIPKNKVGSLTWEVMNFCHDGCLSKYQSVYTSNCCNCNAIVATSSMGKYCVRFGLEVKQFCTFLCLNTYKKGTKTCLYCQKNRQDSSEGVLASVDGKDQLQDFCSPDCFEKFDFICSNSVDDCIVCDKVKVAQFELLSSTKGAKLCSDVCLAAYKFVNNIEVGICGLCNKYYDTMGVDETVTFNNDVPSTFCSKPCMNLHVISERKVVPCAWCKAKKYNCDMVYRRGATDEDALFVCSVNCLVLHNMSNAFPPREVNCSYCKKLDVSIHLAMPDAPIRRFCSFKCLLNFQSAFNVPELNANIPVPEGAAKKIVRSVEASANSTSPGTQTAPSDGPIIQSVFSLKSIKPNNPTGLEILEKSTRENPLASSSTAGLSNACNEMLQMRNEMDTGERNERMLENDDSVEDLVPPKRARVVEEDMSNPETSETPVNMKLKDFTMETIFNDSDSDELLPDAIHLPGSRMSESKTTIHYPEDIEIVARYATKCESESDDEMILNYPNEDDVIKRYAGGSISRRFKMCDEGSSTDGILADGADELLGSNIFANKQTDPGLVSSSAGERNAEESEERIVTNGSAHNAIQAQPPTVSHETGTETSDFNDHQDPGELNSAFEDSRYDSVDADDALKGVIKPGIQRNTFTVKKSRNTNKSKVLSGNGNLSVIHSLEKMAQNVETKCIEARRSLRRNCSHTNVLRMGAKLKGEITPLLNRQLSLVKKIRTNLP